MVQENRDKKGTGIILILFIVVAVFLMIFWFMGVRGLLQILKWLIIILLVLAILGTLIYFIWFFFFKKQKFDVTFVNKQKLIDACHKGNTGVLKGMFISGDKGHSRVFWGKITGWARISVLTRTIRYETDVNGNNIPMVNVDERTGKEEIIYDIGNEEQDVFSVSHASMIGKMFEEEDIVRVSPKDHDELVGDVTMYGFSLLQVSEYWFLNTDLLDVRKIDYAILKEAERGIMFEMLRDTKEIVDKASGLDTDHQKKIEERSMLELPVNMGGGN